MRKAILCFAIAISSCASTPPTNESVDRVRACCKSLSELRYAPLGIEEKESVWISEDSLVFEFPEGKSRFAAFELKRFERIKVLDIEMSISSFYLQSATIFLPSLVFLNSEKQITRAVSDLQVRQLHSDYYFASLAVMPGERYLIVYTDAKAIGQTLPFNKAAAGHIFMSGRTPMYFPGRAGTHWAARDTVGLISLKARE